ncbi:GTPase-activating protein, putative [Entamoeba invadens IP1]|uniref:GTPase-activating protein, putative n=1 Tax=Entamoeba invadens IP1 TaxID=370355 RepID=A0A0A1U5F1_ENTIV|nr:GTPase-activating protein, putative [Entamoeba invadens IP1]ELP89563.1 GTPase-activating protein, putative [Entamoeba invadens IP1]|eukprot:XP_004256334.1 GTPase-activating protein, putative [Entamoeba invadens IP1]
MSITQEATQRKKRLSSVSDPSGNPIVSLVEMAAHNKMQFDKAAEDYESVLLSILKSKLLLRKVIEQRMYQDRIKRGNLTAREISELLKNQGEEEDDDFIQKITELRRTLLNEIRKNSDFDRDIADIENRITLLVQNAGTVLAKDKKKKKKKQLDEESTSNVVLTHEKLELYGNLFFLLQTEPVYLARLINCLQQSESDIKEMLNCILLNLFMEGQTTREDYLILKVVRTAIEQQLSLMVPLFTQIQNQSVVPQMMVIYAKRKEGLKFLADTFSPCVQRLNKEFPAYRKIELNGKRVLDDYVNETEEVTGGVCPLRDLPLEKVSSAPELKEKIQKRVADLKEACNIFYGTIIKSLSHYPYGLRYLCKVINDGSLAAYPNLPNSELLQYTGYFMYYRFVGHYITSNETGQSLDQMQNALMINKVFTQLFQQQTPFPNTEANMWYLPMNDWISERCSEVKQFLTEFTDVEPPETKLQIDKYMTLIQDVKPVVIMTPPQLKMFHQELVDHLEQIANKEDPLRKILGEIKEVQLYEGKDITLTLTPKYIQQSSDDEDQVLYNKTKSMVIGFFKYIKNTESDISTFQDMLDETEKLAKEKNNESVLKTIEEVKKNLDVLCEKGLANKEDNYKQFLKDVAIEISNRAEIKEQQQKELTRLDISIKQALKKQKDLEDILVSYKEYCQQCVQRICQGKQKKGKNKLEGKLFKPKEYSYNDLAKKGVIVSSVVPKAVRKLTKIVISSEEAGVFNVSVKLPGLNAETVDLKLEELLEKRAKGERTVDINEQMELDVSMTIFVMNHLLSK